MSEVSAVHVPNRIVLDVVFIHGLDGDALKTWTPKKPQSFWPRWLAEDLDDVAVWTVNYDAWASGWRGQAMPLQDRAVNLMALLQNHGIGERPLCFVAHSLGGLLVKEILLRAAEGRTEFASFALETKGVVFLATPHTGSGLTKAVDALGILYRKSRAVVDLKRNEPYLRHLNDRYRDWADEVKIRNLVFFETRRTMGLQVVDETSANPGLARVTPIGVDANHIDICKLSDRESLVYGQVRRFVEALPALGRPELPGKAPGHPASPSGPQHVWGGVPARNPGFTGRESTLTSMRSALLGGGRAAVQALRGMGGVGKTQLAAEYAHQHADEYEVVWWIAAERADLIGDQFARLAAELHCAEPSAPLEVVHRTVMADLRDRNQWLLIFDDAKRGDDIAQWLPAGGGHVLITSRTHGWDEIAVPVEVNVLARPESVAILRNRVRGLSHADADLVATAVGDLPIAVTQAAQFMAESGIPADQYADLLRDRAADVQQALAAQTQVTFDRLRAQDPAAADLATICAWLDPDSIPSSWFASAAIHLPGPLAAKAADPVRWRQVLASLTRSTLARFERDELVQHRLIQAIIRGSLAADRAAEMRETAGLVAAANQPGAPEDPGNWPAWGRMMLHLAAVGPGDASSIAVKELAISATRYLTRRGNALGGSDLAMQLRDRWRERFGPDDDFTLRAANNLADSLRDLGRFREARDLDEDTLSRRRRAFGDDNRYTLMSASNLAIDLRELGDSQAAREIDEVTLRQRRGLFGEDHPDTLDSASNLAVDLYNLGEVAAARALNEETLGRRRRKLGEDHPATLISACNLANTLFDSGKIETACELDEDTLARRQRILGKDHPESLLSAVNLVADYTALGTYRPPHDLDRDTLDRCRRILGEDHPTTLGAADACADNLRALREYQAAADLRARILDILRRVFGDDNPRTKQVAQRLEEDKRML